MIESIENRQKFLINKVKSYIKILKKDGIDVSKSSLCYFNTFSPSPGYAKLVFWLKEKNSIKKIISIVLNHIIAIAYYSEIYLINNNNQNFDTILMTWARRTDFKNNLFFDKFSNTSSKLQKKTIYFAIYLDKHLPKKIPQNVIILYNKKKFSFIFLLNSFFKNILKNIFSIRKFFHYFSSQSIFADIVYSKLNSTIGKNKIKKIIFPYEGQPYQNYIIKNLEKKYKNLETIGFTHSMIPALPLNLISRDGSPKIMLLSGNSQKNLFVKRLGWKKKNIRIIKSIRIKKKINENQYNKLFLAMNLENINILAKNFDDFLILQKKKSLPFIKIKKHPEMLMAKSQLYLEKKLKNIIQKNKDKFDGVIRKKNSYHIGPTSALIQYLEKNKNVIHMTASPILDLYTEAMWKEIVPYQINDYTFRYNLTKKGQILRLSNNNYNIFKSKKL